MSIIFDKFIEIIKSFEVNKVDYVIIGGMAINLHGFARNTEDIDIFIKHSEENIAKLNKALFEVFNDKEVYQITFDELNKYAVIRYGTDYDFYIDIISRIGERFSFEDLKYETVVINDVPIKIADPQTLYKLKESTFREIDQLDLKFLKKKLDK